MRDFEIVGVVGALKTRATDKLQVRIGIATGLVVVGDLVGQGTAQEQAVVGDTPNLAARLQGIALPGQVVLAEPTRRLLGDVFDVTHLGGQNLKGIAGQPLAYGVIGERIVESRFEARASGAMSNMVGRDHELALMLERWKQAKAGEGQLVLLSGEAGIGKSRLTRGMIEAVSSEAHIRVSYQCSPYHSDSPLYPVIQQLAFAAGIRPDDDNDDKLDRLEKVLVGAESDRPLFAASAWTADRRALRNPEPDAATAAGPHTAGARQPTRRVVARQACPVRARRCALDRCDDT